jgi:hypothetical protein
MVLTKLSHLAKVIGGRRKPDVDERASLEGAALGDHRSRDPLPTATFLNGGIGGVPA